MGIACTAANRLRVPLVVIGVALAASVAGGCGGDDSGDSASVQEGTVRVADPRVFPQPQGRSFRDVLGDMLQGPQLAQSTPILEPGTNRFGFALFQAGNRQIAELPVVLYLSRGLDETASRPFPARYEPIEVKPQFESQTSAQDPDAAHGVYVAKVRFPEGGSYVMSAVTQLDNKYVATSPIEVTVRSRGSLPSVGDKAVPVHTPTVESVSGNVDSIDTRVPPSTMHEVDLMDALERDRPVVLLFSTPALCQSKVCGPVTDVAEQVRAEYGDRADFIHMEIYKENDVNKGVRPQVVSWGLCAPQGKSVLCNEPFLFTVDRRGNVAAQLQGAFSASELEDAVKKTLRQG
jgi:hypothetical protein